MFVKKYAAGLLAASMASFLPLAHGAPTLVINDGAPVDILTPPGISYAANSGGTASQLDVATSGYVFCANVGTGSGVLVTTLQPQHEGWRLPSGNDARIAYSGGQLAVNSGLQTSLACAARDSAGQLRVPFSGFGDYLFADEWELAYAPERQFANLANWKPVQGFSWSTPDWTLVPNDSCTWDNEENFPHLDESAFCAAATGARPNAVDSPNNPDYGDRAATMWTKRTATNFIYVARIDTSYDGQHGTPNSHFVDLSRPAGVDTPSTIQVAVRDAFDSDYLTANATYCFLNKLPTAAEMGDNICASPSAYFTGTLPNGSNAPNSSNGIMTESLSLGVNSVQARSLYVAVVRKKVVGGASPSSCQPYAAIAVMPQSDVVRQFGADEFIGDDVVFGFREDESFDWMGCIN